MASPAENEIWAALDEVKDPEIPVISVVEMGIVTGVRLEEGRVTVLATPTYVGCPALSVIKDSIERRLKMVPWVEDAEVQWVMDPHWTSDRITPAGREKLKGFGLAPPPHFSEVAEWEENPACPFCHSQETHMENLFGPTACRMIFYCDHCHNPFEAIKRV